MELSSSPIEQMVAVEVAAGAAPDGGPGGGGGGGSQTMYLRGLLDGRSGGVKFVLCAEGEVLRSYLRTKRWMKAMLHDEARNTKYKRAIRAAVADWRASEGAASTTPEHRPLAAGDDGSGGSGSTRAGPVVVDIGAGTGLLSMLAAEGGASSIVALEMFPPIASFASRILEANRLRFYPHLHQQDVRVVNAASTDLLRIEPPADIVVCELFDTVLNNEGILPTLRHAFANLTVSPSARVVPEAASVYAVLLDCPELVKWHAMSVAANSGEARVPETPQDFRQGIDGLLQIGRHGRTGEEAACSSGLPPLRVHLEELLRRHPRAKPLTEPFRVWDFDFRGVGFTCTLPVKHEPHAWSGISELACWMRLYVAGKVLRALH